MTSFCRAVNAVCILIAFLMLMGEGQLEVSAVLTVAALANLISSVKDI